jgi:hypothetical protein
MRMLTIVFLAVVGLSSANTAVAKPVAKPQGHGAPKVLLGAWEIVAVRLDVHAGPYKIPYRPNDVRFAGIELVIEPNRTIYDITEVCERPTWETRSSIVKKEVNYRRTPSARAPKGMLAPLKDMGFQSLRLNDKVTTYSLKCAGDSSTSAERFNFFMTKDTRQLYAADGDIYLVFKRRASAAQPNPSFTCAGELSVTQRTICSSVGLSLRERSLADVWVQSSACRAAPDCSEEKRKSQQQAASDKYRDWLKGVDSCGTAVICTLEKIREMASELSTNQLHVGNVDLR